MFLSKVYIYVEYLERLGEVDHLQQQHKVEEWMGALSVE